MSSHYFDNNNAYEENSVLEPTILVEGVVWDERNLQEPITMCVSENDTSALGTSNNETFLSINEEGNNTEYFSVLEMSDGVMDDLSLTAVNPAITDNTLCEEVSSDGGAVSEEPNLLVQPLLYGIEGSDDYLAVQVTYDNEGNMSRLQYRMRQNENGEFESIPGTAEILPIEDVPLDHTQQTIPEEQVTLSKDDTLDSQPHIQVIIKVEQQNETIISGYPTPTAEELCNADDEQDNEQESDEIEPKLDIVHNSKEWIKNEALHQSPNSSLSYTNMHTEDLKSSYVAATKPQTENIEQPSELFPTATIYDSENVSINGYDGENVPLIGDTFENGAAMMFSNEQSNTYQSIENQIINDNQQEELQSFLANSENSEDVNYTSDLDHAENQDNVDADDEQYMSRNETESSDENASESDAEEYQIVEGIHITGDTKLRDLPLKDSGFEKASNCQDLYSLGKKPQFIEVLKSHQQSILIDKMSKKLKTTLIQNTDGKGNKNLYYIVKNPEKENVAVPRLNVNKVYKVNPRSILKTSFAQLEQQQQKEDKKKPVQEQNLNSGIDKIDKRFARNKDVIQALLFQNYIAKTTIPHAPVRQERLPRKQKIKPVQRADEEIIVKEVVVSSQGFVEFPDENLLPKACVEIVQLTDSEEETEANSRRRRNKNKSKISEIIISDTEDEPEGNKIVQIDLSAESEGETNQSEVPEVKRPRGRPRKNPLPNDGKATPNDKNQSSESTGSDSSILKRKRGRPPKNKNNHPGNSKDTNEQTDQKSNSLDYDSSSSAKKQRTDSENASNSSNSLKLDSSEEKAEIPCLKCSKSFPSQGSLKTHMQYHSLRESANKNATSHISRITQLHASSSNKYQCSKCGEMFKNNALLNKHEKLHDSNSRALECGLCKKVFADMSQLSNHKRSHVKEQMFKCTIPPKISPKAPRTSRQFKSPPKRDIFKCPVCSKVFPTLPALATHKTSAHKQFCCANCSKVFFSKVAWESHVRQSCVKRKHPEKRATLNVRKSLLASPQRVSKRHSFKGPRSAVNSESLANKTRIPIATVKITCCDKCGATCSSYKQLFEHKVLEHGLETPDKSIVGNKSRRTLSKSRRDQAGVPATRGLASTWVGLRSKME